MSSTSCLRGLLVASLPILAAGSLRALEPTAGAGDPWIAIEEAKLTAHDHGAGDELGRSIAAWGDTAVVGAPSADGPGGDQMGAVYVFKRTGTLWGEQAKLTASDGAAGDYFGKGVAIWGDTIVVGAAGSIGVGQPTIPGAAYVFVRNGTTWSEEAKLVAGDGATPDHFGFSVTLEGDTAVVGAFLDDHAGGTNAGSAYVFERSGTTWSETAKLIPADTAAGKNFGLTVAISGDSVLIGSQEAFDYDGSAYVFVRSGATWSEQAKLVASDGDFDDLFGTGLALSGDTALIGAPFDDHGGLQDAGSAYVFTRSGTSWSQQQKLTISDATAMDYAGFSVTLSGDTAVLGVQGHSFTSFSEGAAYVFEREGATWNEVWALSASDKSGGDYFGASVAIAGDRVVVGALLDDLGTGSGFSAGSAYAFQLIEAIGAYCTAGTSASGCQALIHSSGVASASASSGFELMTANGEGDKSGLFFLGTNGQQAIPWGNGTSFQCLVPPVARAGLLHGTGTVGQCNGVFLQDLNATWCPTCPKPGLNPGNGATVQAQLWYRDPLSTSNQTSSLSNAIEFGVTP